MTDSRHLTEDLVADYREAFILEANRRLDDGLPSTAWVSIKWEGGKPHLGPTQDPDSSPALGQRRYTLFDLSNGDFRL